MNKLRFAVWLGAALLAFAAACTAPDTETLSEGTEMNLTLTSSAFTEGQPIPAQYTCQGENLSPPLAWSGVPQNTQSLALIVDDPDAPSKTWVHWVVYNLSPTLTELPEGLTQYDGPGSTGIAGVNDSRKTGYSGPCPPPGSPHRYFFKLYALDTQLNLPEGATKAQVEQAMQGHILAQGQLMGTYKR